MMRKSFVCTIAIVIVAVSTAWADQPPAETTTITGNVLTNVTGVFAVNQTAGNGNVQSNVAVIGKGGAPSVHQSAVLAPSETGHVSIGDFAFSSVSGILQVNQSAGTGNAQANVVYVSDNALSAAVPQQSTPTGAPASNGANLITVAKTAFVGARGIVQVSQVAGTSNCTANTFALQLPGVAGH